MDYRNGLLSAALSTSDEFLCKKVATENSIYEKYALKVPKIDFIRRWFEMRVCVCWEGRGPVTGSKVFFR